jgi:hypothetical protein
LALWVWVASKDIHVIASLDDRGSSGCDVNWDGNQSCPDLTNEAGVENVTLPDNVTAEKRGDQRVVDEWCRVDLGVGRE